jgi:hypothetical protein
MSAENCAISLNGYISSIRTSSSYSSEYKSANMLELTNLESCWSSKPCSDNNSSAKQIIQIEFSADQFIHFSQLEIRFAGGFAAKRFNVQYVFHNPDEKNNKFLAAEHFEPADNNSLQIFQCNSHQTQHSVRAVKVVLENSTDFYGRFTVYTLECKGLTK